VKKFAENIEQYNNTNVSKAEALLEMNLTEKQKLNDFNAFFNVVTTSNPMINDYKDLYGFSFSEREEQYKNIVKSTQNDFEFYCVMNAIANDIPSIHTSFFFPDYETIQSYYCYNAENTIATKDLEASTYYWYNTIKKSFQNKEYNTLIFNYIDGKYVNNDALSSYKLPYTLIEITKINDIPINKYIQNHLSISKLQYDFINNIPYRPALLFNDKYGEPVQLEFVAENGEIITQNMYVDLYSEYAFACQNCYLEQLVEDLPESHYSVDLVQDNEIIYVYVNDFSNSYGTQLYSDLRNAILHNNASVILDLRNNTGGTIDYERTFLYPSLFNTDITRKDTAYMICSKNNRKVYNNYILQSVHGFKRLKEDCGFNSDNSYMYTETDYFYRGDNNVKTDVYILTSPVTASAADHFVSVVKDNNLATIIGTNTAGEGMMGTLFMDSLPNSKLVYLYTPAKAFNSDGKDNSTFGTAPDIYAELSVSGFEKKQQLISQGIDPYTYENRLKWDDVLIETLKIIKEKENNK
jgi:C-terminal processing protease CtpA/Prc